MIQTRLRAVNGYATVRTMLAGAMTGSIPVRIAPALAPDNHGCAIQDQQEGAIFSAVAMPIKPRDRRDSRVEGKSQST